MRRKETGDSQEPDAINATPGSRVTARLVIFAVGYVALIVLGILLSHWVTAQLDIDIHLSPETDALWNRVVLIAFFTYVVLMTLPFVPGVEIGLALLARISHR